MSGACHLSVSGFSLKKRIEMSLIERDFNCLFTPATPVTGQSWQQLPYNSKNNVSYKNKNKKINNLTT